MGVRNHTQSKTRCLFYVLRLKLHRCNTQSMKTTKTNSTAHNNNNNTTQKPRKEHANQEKTLNVTASPRSYLKTHYTFEVPFQRLHSQLCLPAHTPTGWLCPKTPCFVFYSLSEWLAHYALSTFQSTSS